MQKQISSAAAKTATVALLVGMMVALVVGVATVSPEKAYASAKKETVYVVTKTTENSADYGNRVFTFTYKSNGLVNTIKNNSANSTLTDQVGTEKYVYSKNKLKSVKTLNAAGKTYYTYSITRNKKGYATKGEYLPGIAEVSLNPDAFKYNKTGLLIKYKFKRTGDWDWDVVTYDKKGRIATMSDGRFKFAYDAKNNIKSVTATADGSKLVTCKNTYKGNRLTKKVTTFKYSSGTIEKFTCTYKYKKMKVPASVAAKVKAQQQTILFGEQSLSMNHFQLSIGRPFLISVS